MEHHLLRSPSQTAHVQCTMYKTVNFLLEERQGTQAATSGDAHFGACSERRAPDQQVRSDLRSRGAMSMFYVFNNPCGLLQFCTVLIIHWGGYREVRLGKADGSALQ